MSRARQQFNFPFRRNHNSGTGFLATSEPSRLQAPGDIPVRFPPELPTKIAPQHLNVIQVDFPIGVFIPTYLTSNSDITLVEPLYQASPGFTAPLLFGSPVSTEPIRVRFYYYWPLGPYFSIDNHVFFFAVLAQAIMLDPEDSAWDRGRSSRGRFAMRRPSTAASNSPTAPSTTHSLWSRRADWSRQWRSRPSTA